MTLFCRADGAAQTETVLFNAGDAGVKNLQFAIDALPEEENKNNNALTRVLYVDNAKPKILYMEGEPRWDYKFIRRAVEDDKNISLYTRGPHHAEQAIRAGAHRRPDGRVEGRLPHQSGDLFRLPGHHSGHASRRIISLPRSRI